MSTSGDIEPVLAAYRVLLKDVDDWFAGCRNVAGVGQIACQQGCHECCRGLFDITLLDAFLLQKAFLALPEVVQAQVRERALPRLSALQQLWPQLEPPYVLNDLPDEDWMEMPEEDEIPCPLVGADGLCLVYDARPMTCRLHGLPHVDDSGEIFLDSWCDHNFPEGDPLADASLRWSFRAAFECEAALLRELALSLTGVPLHELDTFIPLVLLKNYEKVNWPMWGRQFRKGRDAGAE